MADTWGRIADIFRIRQLLRQQELRIVADLGPIFDALTNLSTQITQLAAQVAALQAGTVTQAELDDIATRIGDAAKAVDAIVEPDAGEAPA